MPKYYEKLIEEEKQLHFKVNNLATFKKTDKWEDLDEWQKHLLEIQEKAMITYLQILNSRIKYEKELLILKGYKL